MEGSEASDKRKERLKAMRMEASAAEKQVSSHVETYTGSGFLPNPLIETSATTMMQESSKTPRFDFYTDPMAAFSTNKKSKASNHIAQADVAPTTHSGSPETRFSPSFQGSVNPEMAPPVHQGQQSYYSPHQSYQRPVYYSGFAPHRSPARMGSPFPMHQGTTPGGWNRPGSIPPFPMHQGTTPGGWNRPERIPNYGFPSNAGAGTVSPDFGVYGPGVDHGQSRGHWLGTSPNRASGHGGGPSSGRGRGHWHGSSMSPGSGRSGGRGRGFHPRGLQPDGTLGPERLYDKSMVEDPWQHLKPIIWKSLDTPGTSNSWLPQSISMKKERVPESRNKTSSQPSLAEYLAASFNEAVDDAAGV
ncbi:RNA-binding protein FUS isoform X2 [Tripterygium wilfordii]|uniref:RNA-binding protein FUS isoform X2 n=1 Tax=Tripterygium wilfordii TaxID=458696 RepID=A0A7J7D1D1_TRIWF|nr:protein SICKLE-like [Tripterygium wilfordii]KAF5740141.1 RNA-binding protein FUS isoform X2 [Tripterygium wilfordii]